MFKRFLFCEPARQKMVAAAVTAAQKRLSSKVTSYWAIEPLVNYKEETPRKVSASVEAYRMGRERILGNRPEILIGAKWLNLANNASMGKPVGRNGNGMNDMDVNHDFLMYPTPMQLKTVVNEKKNLTKNIDHPPQTADKSKDAFIRVTRIEQADVNAPIKVCVRISKEFSGQHENKENEQPAAPILQNETNEKIVYDESPIKTVFRQQNYSHDNSNTKFTDIQWVKIQPPIN